MAPTPSSQLNVTEEDSSVLPFVGLVIAAASWVIEAAV